MRDVLESFAFRVLSILTLVIALFASGLCILLDLPDRPTNLVVDILMLSVSTFWSGEMVLRCIVERADYALTFFFWMDLMSIFSMAFEISFLLGVAGKETTVDASTSAMTIRLAQLSRVAFRFGRLCKPLRILSMLYSGRRKVPSGQQDGGYSAKVLGDKLSQVFSAKVATLTVVLVLGVPIFGIGKYPEADFSLRLSSLKLEADYARAYSELSRPGSTNTSREADKIFEASVMDLADFYDVLNYHPYRLEGYDSRVSANNRDRVVIAGATIIDLEEPRRKQNVVKQTVSGCLVPRQGCSGDDHAAIYFDFTAAHQYAALLDVCVLVFIMLCMGFVVCDITRTMNKMVADPLEKMLLTAHSMASVLNQAIRVSGGLPEETFDSVDTEDKLTSTSSPTDRTNASVPSRAREKSVSAMDELQKLIKKMALLTRLFVEQNVVDEAKMQGLDNESRGVIVEVMRYGRGEARRLSRKSSLLSGSTALSDMPLPDEELWSWGLNILHAEAIDRPKIVHHIFFDSSIGQLSGRILLDFNVFQAFVSKVETTYLDLPYHSFAHGLDVLSSCCRIVRQVQWDEWLTEIDTVALLIAALCHDIGHPGKTNPFLVETGNELALRYNDKSPLENMHCARLFEICTGESTNIFLRFDRASYKQARSICINAILYTDNALHFDLVKEVKKVYETSSDLCDAQVDGKDNQNSEKYMQDVVVNNTSLWIKVFLHMADVSNPLKTFALNKLWADRVVEEFFAQGDEEKRLGLPVGMLNDRDKVTRSGAEHGFIVFLLSPLVTSTISVFPSLHPLSVQMVNNMVQWKELWKTEASPTPEDIKKRDEDIAGVQDKVTTLKARCGPPQRVRTKTNPGVDSRPAEGQS